MKTTTYTITARNSDNQWNWDGFEFLKNGRGDATTLQCDPIEWNAAKKSFHCQFRAESQAILKLEKSIYDDESEDFVDEVISHIKA